MKEAKILPIEFSGGMSVNYDLSLLGEKETAACINAGVNRGVLTPIGARAKVVGGTNYNAAPTLVNYAPCHLWERYYGGTVKTFACFTKDIYEWTASTKTFSASVVTLTAEPTQRINTAHVSNDFILASGYSNTVKWYNGTAWADLTNATNFKAKYVAYFFNRVILADMVDTAVNCYFRIRYSEVGSVTTWSGGTTGFVDLVEDWDSFTGLQVLGDRLYLFRADSIWEISHVGGDKVFAYNKISSGVGCIAPDSIAVCNDQIIFVSRAGVYSLSAQGIINVGTAIIRNLQGEARIPYLDVDTYLWDQYQDVSSSCAAYQKDRNKYYLLVPRLASLINPLYPFMKDKTFVLDLDTKTWSIDTLTGLESGGSEYYWRNNFIACERYLPGALIKAPTGLEFVSVPGDVVLSFMSYNFGGVQGGYILAYDLHNPYTSAFSNGSFLGYSGVSATIITRIIDIGGYCRWLELEIESYGAVTVVTSLDRGVTWANLADSSDPTSDIQRFALRGTSATIQFRIIVSVPDTSTDLTKTLIQSIILKYIPRKGRR